MLPILSCIYLKLWNFLDDHQGRLEHREGQVGGNLRGRRREVQHEAAHWRH